MTSEECAEKMIELEARLTAQQQQIDAQAQLIERLTTRLSDPPSQPSPPTTEATPAALSSILIMYRAEADREVFSTLRTLGVVQHYIKWEKVKGTGSGGMNVIGPLEESDYCIVMIILPHGQCQHIFSEIAALRTNMLKKTGIASLIFPISQIG